MTLTQPTVDDQANSKTFEMVGEDIYKDIHKGIRAELFGITGSTGRMDPADRAARVATAARLDRLVYTLVSHAGHEDGSIQPKLFEHRPDLAEQIETEHEALEARLEDLRGFAAEAVDASRADQRRSVNRLYIELASFTSAYLAHQDTEERVVMPALEAAIGPDAVIELHQEIVAGIPPADMAESLGLMLPAMNIDDRVEMLGGMRDGAPAEIFAGVWGLAGSVLTHVD
jgi:hypothetical protein